MLTSQKAAPQIVAETIAQIPTRFGRLLYLARCRSATGEYRHDGIQLTHTESSVDAALRDAHERAWRDWLNMDLHAQHEDFGTFAADLNITRLVKRWTEAEPWTALAPPSAGEHERDLFASDFRQILHLLQALTSR